MEEKTYRLLTYHYNKRGEWVNTEIGKISNDKESLLHKADLITDNQKKTCEIVILDVIIGKW